MSYTYTKTFVRLDAWAESFPSTELSGGWRPGEPCQAPQCTELLAANEVFYYVTELERLSDGREPAVCWRHVRPDDGPIVVPAAP